MTDLTVATAGADSQSATTPQPAADASATSDITTPLTADATPDAGKTEDGEPTADAAKNSEPTPDKGKEPTKAELRAKQRNRDRWAEMKAKLHRAEAAEAELAKLKGAAEPDWTQYADPNQEVAERVLHTLRKEQIPLLEQQVKTSRAEAEKIVDQAFDEAIVDARVKYPDFDAVVFNPAATFPKQMVSYVANSEKGADVAYYLGKNPGVARQLAETFAQSQAAGFIELGRIEGKVSAPTSKPASTAPKPPPIIAGGSNPPAFDPAKASVGDMAAHLKKAGVLR